MPLFNTGEAVILARHRVLAIDETELRMEERRIEQSVIDDLVSQIGEANLRILVAKVQKEVPVLWLQLMQASRANDQASALRSVHSLASICKSVGLLAVGEGLSDIESRLRSGSDMNVVWLDGLELEKQEGLKELDLLCG